MGIKDQFQDKAEELRNKAQAAMSGAEDEASERGRSAQESDRQGMGDTAARDARDGSDQDLDA
ncbi:hypothetical protein [Streptomyces sp. NPDC087294]|uniref:hypothetical protein n=1 Tax=Streptomyces sp. NPDC087294 TaxID=3365777 RepID=UPI003810F57E